MSREHTREFARKIIHKNRQSGGAVYDGMSKLVRFAPECSLVFLALAVTATLFGNRWAALVWIASAWLGMRTSEVAIRAVEVLDAENARHGGYT